MFYQSMHVFHSFGTEIWYVRSCLNAFCFAHYPEYRNGVITKMQQNDAVNVNLESIFIVTSHEGQYSRS